MWCPEGYVTLSEAFSSALQVARGLVYPQYGDATDIYALSDGTIPRGAQEMALALGTWLLEDLLRQDGWGVSTPDGVFVRLKVSRLLEVDDCRVCPINLFQLYNPITTVGPPSQEWLTYYGNRYLDGFVLVNVRRGVVRGAVPWTFWKSALLGKLHRFFPQIIGFHHITRAHYWGVPFATGWKFRGRAICLKASDLERWVNQTNEYLAVFLVGSTDPVSSRDFASPTVELSRRKGRKPTTRKEVAAAILELYGNVHEPVTGWKETVRQIEARISRNVSVSTLRRAFEGLRDN